MSAAPLRNNNIDLFGKHANDLQQDIIINSDNEITGTLKYIDDYSSAFSGDEASGNYIVLKFRSDPEAEITVTITNPVTLDDDRIFVGRIADKDSQTITVVASKDGESVTEVYTLDGLTCEAAG